MTDEEIYEEMDFGTTVRQQPHPYPPNKLGERAVFWLDAIYAAPGWPEGWHDFEFVQTFTIAMALVSKSGAADADSMPHVSVCPSPLVWIGEDLDGMLLPEDIFTPRTAEEHYADLVARKVDRDHFAGEQDWLDWCAMHADENCEDARSASWATGSQAGNCGVGMMRNLPTPDLSKPNPRIHGRNGGRNGQNVGSQRGRDAPKYGRNGTFSRSQRVATLSLYPLAAAWGRLA